MDARVNVSRKLLVCLAAMIVLLLLTQVRAEQRSPDSAEPELQGRLQTTTTKTLERFVPDAGPRAESIEICAEAVVPSGQIRLRQIARWPEDANETFAPIAELIVYRMQEGRAFENVSLDQIRAFLADAGVNMARLNIGGAATCTVSRSDIKYDEGQALRDWVRDNAQTANGPQTDVLVAAVESQRAALRSTDTLSAPLRREDQSLVQSPAAGNGLVEARSLRTRLTYDVATRLKLDPNDLQVEFQAEDRQILDLAEPLVQFDIQPMRAGDLGVNSWLVSLNAGGTTRKVQIRAGVRAWQTQVAVARPMAAKQLITELDVQSKRILADKLSGDPLVSMSQVVGQQAARDLRVGMVLTGRMIDPVQLARAGQPITVIMRRGALEVRTVATAMGSGTYGQEIKVRNEATRQVLEAKLAGPQLAIVGDNGTPVASVE